MINQSVDFTSTGIYYQTIYELNEVETTMQKSELLSSL